MSATVLLVDGSNVARCQAWREFVMTTNDDQLRTSLLDALLGWQVEHSHENWVVFDGQGPLGGGEHEWFDPGKVVGSGDHEGDVVVQKLAARLAREGRTYWLVTSDRALQLAAGARAERVVDADAFVTELRALFDVPDGYEARVDVVEYRSTRLSDTLDADIQAKLERMRRGEPADD